MAGSAVSVYRLLATRATVRTINSGFVFRQCIHHRHNRVAEIYSPILARQFSLFGSGKSSSAPLVQSSSSEEIMVDKAPADQDGERVPFLSDNANNSSSSVGSQDFSAEASAIDPTVINSSESIPQLLSANDVLVIPDDPAVHAFLEAAALPSDHIGFLQSIGLAKTWFWPWDICERLIEFVHVAGDMPWWLAIVCTTLAVRLLAAPAYIQSSDHSAKALFAAPKLRELDERLKKEGPDYVQDYLKDREAVMKQYGVRMGTLMLPMFVNLLVSGGMIMGLELMAKSSFSDFTTQGAAWFTNLSAPDPYLGLHLISFLCFAASIKLGGENAVRKLTPKVEMLLMIVGLLSIYVTKDLPTGLVLFFATSSSFQLIQTRLLQVNRFRRLIRITPLPTASERAAMTPKHSDSVQDQLRAAMDILKKQAEQQQKKNGRNMK
ncbi:60Kd inner membrane protein-domain-containing protein [Lipomyces oligophaga]|uniref:60Kd inner membrane protein-domain-containing protein n=1 Tax=Lipomyces oligophaga TaxID=45792 RepID=UPI0034CF3414